MKLQYLCYHIVIINSTNQIHYHCIHLLLVIHYTEQPTPFNVVFISGNIKVCQGCHNNYPRPLLPPNDICIQHSEWREYLPPGCTATKSKWGNAYYHCNVSCIMARWPAFSSSMIIIDPRMIEKFALIHKSFLNITFGLALQ